MTRYGIQQMGRGLYGERDTFSDIRAGVIWRVLQWDDVIVTTIFTARCEGIHVVWRGPKGLNLFLPFVKHGWLTYG